MPVIPIYGANAAGKSNVIDALLLMREMVCGNFAKPLKGDELPYEPFAFVDGQTEPTAFEIIYYYDDIKYAYGFSFDKDRIISEYLYHWPNGREALVSPGRKISTNSVRAFRNSFPLPDVPPRTDCISQAQTRELRSDGKGVCLHKYFIRAFKILGIE